MSVRHTLPLLALLLVAGSATAQDGARLQVIHNAPDPAAALVDVYVNGDLLLDDLAFRDGTPFIDAAAGETTVDITAADAADNSDPVFSETYTLEAGTTYQLIASGVVEDDDEDDNDFTLLVSADAQEAPATDATTVAVRVVHGSPDAPAVDVRAGGDVLVDDAEYTDITDYLELPPASYELAVTTADGTTTVGTFVAPLADAAGTAVTVLASGFLSPDGDDEPGLALLAVFADGTEAVLTAQATSAEGAPDSGLSLAIPNPVRGAATVAYGVTTAGSARVAVYDLLGREVAVLVDGPTSAGEQTAALDASALAAGAYVVRLETEAGALSRTVTVVR